MIRPFRVHELFTHFIELSLKTEEYLKNLIKYDVNKNGCDFS